MFLKILKRIVAATTVLGSVAYLIYTLITNDYESKYEEVMISIMILLAIDFALMHAGDERKWKQIDNDIQQKIDKVSNIQITSYSSSQAWVEALNLIVKDGEHIVENASLDTHTRSKAKGARHPVWEHIKSLSKNKKIKFRQIIRVNKSSFTNLMERITAGSFKEESYYAYYDLPGSFSFPTFGIIDNKYVAMRSPYSEGGKPNYLIISNSELVMHYYNYFNDLWERSKHIGTIQDIKDLYEKIKSSCSENEMEKLKKQMEIIEKKELLPRE